MELLNENRINVKSFWAKDKHYRGFFGRSRWSLCVGAGISSGIVPTWFDLTYLVYKECFNKVVSKIDFSKMVEQSGWSLDSWLQHSLNHMLLQNKNEKDFADILKNILYKDLIERANKWNLKDELILAFNDPFRLHHEKVVELCDFFEKEYPNNSTLQLIHFLLKAIKGNKAPNAIISFNADAIFDAFLYLYYCKQTIETTGNKSFKRRKFSRILRTVENNKNDLIPIFHLHGCLFPNEGVFGYQKKSSSVSKLIFDENSYIKVAGNMYNWAQTTFLYHAQFDQLIFVGLSMSDSNIRKWLSWTSENHNNELKETRKKDIINLNHLWICKSNKSEIELKKDSLIHLGTRIAWINKWNELEKGLNNILGI